MDPDEEGGDPRRSRRLQRLEPTLPNTPITTHSNNTPYISSAPVQVEEASMSQYGTARTPSESSTPITLRPHSIQSEPPLSNTSTSVDPPEDPPMFISRHQSPPPAQQTPPQSIDIQTSIGPSDTPRQEPHNQLSSNSSITSTMQFVTLDEFAYLQNTVQQMQQNMNTVNNTLSTVSTRQNEIQHTLNTVKSTMQSTITEAIVNAMNNLQLHQSTPPSNNHTTTMHMPNITHPHMPPPTPYNTHPTNTPLALNQPIPSPIPITSQSSNNHLQNTSTFTIEDLINITTSNKINFPTYTKTQDIREWKTLCILELASSSKPLHREMIKYDDTGDPQFQHDMSKAANQELFRLTTKSISSKINTKTFVTVEVIKKADGLALWDILEARLKRIDKDEMELAEMTTAFMSICKSHRETDEVYIQRFEDRVSDMEFYNIKPNAQLQVIVFLSGLKNTLLIEPIMQIRQSPNSIYSNWVIDGNIRHTLTKANTYIEQKIKHTPTTHPSTRIQNPAPAKSQQLPSTSYAGSVIQPPPQAPHYQRYRNPTTPTPPSHHPTSMDAPNIQQLQQTFKNELLSAPNKQDCIFTWRNKNRRSCVFSPWPGTQILSMQSHSYTCP